MGDCQTHQGVASDGGIRVRFAAVVFVSRIAEIQEDSGYRDAIIGNTAASGKVFEALYFRFLFVFLLPLGRVL